MVATSTDCIAGSPFGPRIAGKVPLSQYGQILGANLYRQSQHHTNDKHPSISTSSWRTDSVGGVVLDSRPPYLGRRFPVDAAHSFPDFEVPALPAVPIGRTGPPQRDSG